MAALAEARHTGWEVCSSRSARTWTTSGTAPTSSSTATPSCSRRSASRSSTRSRPAHAPSSARSGRRVSPAPATTATPSGTPSASSCRCSPTRRRVRLPTRFAGATRRSSSRASAPRQLGLEGAAFPWRTIRGQECSGYWPAGTAAFHIGADIADAVVRYQNATGDDDVRARGRARAARGDGALLALARTPRRAGRLPHRRRHRAGRVQRDRRQQRLHQPDGPAEPARCGRGRPAPSAARRRARRRLRGGGRLAGRGRGHGRPLGRLPRGPPAVGGLHRAPDLGLRRHRRPSNTHCCSTTPTSTSTASRS